LAEVRPETVQNLHKLYPKLPIKVIGVLQRRKGITIEGEKLNFSVLHSYWNSTFKKALCGRKGKEVVK
jgi:hypothetical protein